MSVRRGGRAGPRPGEKVSPWARTGHRRPGARQAERRPRGPRVGLGGRWPLLWGGGRRSLLPLQEGGAEVGAGWPPGPSQTGFDVQSFPCSEKGKGQVPGPPPPPPAAGEECPSRQSFWVRRGGDSIKPRPARPAQPQRDCERGQAALIRLPSGPAHPGVRQPRGVQARSQAGATAICRLSYK